MNKKLYELMDWAEMEAITYAEADKPKNLLGARSLKKNQSLVQGYYPGCEKMYISVEDGKYSEMDMADEEGFFATLLKVDYPFMYKLKAELSDGRVLEYTDPYSFGQIMPEKVLKAFNEGNLNNAYEYLGANVTEIGGIKGTAFCVYAPNAMRVSVVGTFNDWDGRIHQMQKIDDNGVFELFVPGVADGDLYKFEIKLRDGSSFLKPDPYAKATQMMPDNASIVTDISKFEYSDKKYITKRAAKDIAKEPMIVYEVNIYELMSKTKGAKTCADVADKLIAHMKKFSYTHVEFMPVMNCVDEKSKGYDTVSYFTINPSLGTVDDFRTLIDKLHANDFGVILEWSIDHFPNDDNFLKNFDGSCVFEHQDPRRGYNPKYGTLLYNYGRPQIVSFLLSAAKYYIKELHVDGIKSTISSMLYLDYDKQDGEWLPNIYGGKENLDAIEFLKKLNNMLTVEHKGIISIARDDTAWFDVTKPVADGGLGFSLKWNNGMVEDVLSYVKNEPLARSMHYGELCFPLVYAFNEKFVLNLSHEQYENGDILNSLQGSDDEKEAALRTFLGFYMMHPGKKLLYMGFDELNPQLSKYIIELNKLYCSSECLHSADFDEKGFEWINCISANENIVVFMRKSVDTDKIYIILCNFISAPRNNYKIGVPGPCEVKEIFNSDAEKYGGFGFTNNKAKLSRGDECDGYDDSVRIKVPPLGMAVFEYQPLED